MKLSTSFLIVGILAFCLGASNPNHSALVSAQPAVAPSQQLEKEIDASDSAPAPLPFDYHMNRLSLLGLDPSKPLTVEEAAFLEGTIQEAFNKFHQDMGIDLYAETVSVGTHAIFPNKTLAADQNTTHTSNLRGGSGRKLEREFQGKPQQDWNWCWYRSGPKYGQWIPGCEFNVELYFCCRCWMCIDDDWAYMTKKPTQKPTLGFYERLDLFLGDDDFEFMTKKPTAAPTKTPSKAPSEPPTEKEEEIGLEKERSPEQPNFNKEILKKLKKSRFKRFNNVKKVRFGYGN